MKRLALLLAVLIVASFSTLLQSQVAPNCDGTDCTPDTTSPGYGGAVAARTQMQNARGYRNPTVALSKVPLVNPPAVHDRRCPLSSNCAPLPIGPIGTGDPNQNATVVGSQSYNYTIPILRLPGRAGLDLVLNLYYNSRVWSVDTTNATATFNVDRDFPSYGFRLDFGYLEQTGVGGDLILTESDGSKHTLVSNGSAVFYSTDGTNIAFDMNGSNVLSYPNGRKVQYQQFPSNSLLLRPVWIKDANGNYLSIGYVSGHDQLLQAISDTLGRVLWFNYNGTQLTSITQSVAPSANDPSGVHTYATFTWGNPYPTGYSWYNFSGLTVNAAPAASQVSVLTALTYANGTGYKFTYGDWGIVDRIETLSSSGATRSYIAYDYPAANQSPLTDAPTYSHETISPDGGSANNSVWTYAVTKAGTGEVTSMSITDPLGTSTTTNLDPNGMKTSIQVRDAAGTLLRTTGYTWTNAGAGTVPGTITTTLNDSGQQSSIQYAYNLNGECTDIYEYDFGGALKRHTVTSYLNASNTTYHILNLATRILLEDGSGNVISRTDMGYDENGLTSVTGAANHDDSAFGASFNTRGNITSIARYDAAGNRLDYRPLYYDSLGNVKTQGVTCCYQKVFNFSSGTQYAYVDSVTRGQGGTGSAPRFTTSATYNKDFGLLATSTDENGQVTQYQYDSMMRQTKVTGPAQTTGSVQVLTAFDDSAASPTVTTSYTNSGNNAVTVSTLDGLGHVTRTDNKNGPTATLSSTTYAYDPLWRQWEISNPFAPAETPVYTGFRYDGLNRITRITPPSAGVTQYQYYGNSATITDPAGNQRKNFTDALGRLIEVDEPGWGDALPATGWVTISGREGFYCNLFYNNRCYQPIYDSGNVGIKVNGIPKSVPYGKGSSASGIAGQLRDAINGDTSYPVWASVSGSTLTLTARQAGAIGNSYTLAASSSTNDPADFGSGSFTTSTSNPAFTNGKDAVQQSSPTLDRPVRATYTYDISDHLTWASVGAMDHVGGQALPGQLRTFAYDALGRLTTATAPESGTVTNFYTNSAGGPCADDPSLVCRIQDARGVVRTFSYDGINRLSSVAYSDGTPGVTYTYDTGGAGAFALTRLTRVDENGNSQVFTYDNLGRNLSANYSIDGVTYPLSYTYTPLGDIVSVTYPTGRTVNQNYDGVERLQTVLSGGIPHFTVTAYNAANQVTGITLGNQVQGNFTYNDHKQLASLRYFASGSSQDFANFSYDYNGNSGNNGQVRAVHYYTSPGVEDPTKSESFSYDPWSRLISASTGTVSAGTPGTWSLQWAYDRLGNRTQQTLVGGSVSIVQPQFSIDTNSNRISNAGFAFDAAGNMTSDGVNKYSYDGANRLTQINSGSATYTYLGPLRIKKTNGGNTTLTIYSGDKPIVDYLNGSLSKEYLYASGRLLATVAGGTTTYHHPDLLSNRAETNSSPSLTRTYGHFPFGETWYETGTPDKFKFSGYETDSGSGETGLNYAQFRFYSPSLGRWLSPDPYSGSMRLVNPESLNRYAYLMNDPTSLRDPLGLDCVYLNDAGDGVESVDTLTDATECGDNGGFYVSGTFIFGFVYGDNDNVFLVGQDGDGNYTASFDVANGPGGTVTVADSGTFMGVCDLSGCSTSWGQLMQAVNYYKPGGDHWKDPDDLFIRDLANAITNMNFATCEDGREIMQGVLKGLGLLGEETGPAEKIMKVIDNACR